ncbi:GNAT family N-acetyltransferase [Mycoplasmopsis caviae]|uniref:Acetyltransferase n=1 Tax=Mycoplasmopsis caviae TaxID=55603 RepID=A0A3P8K9U9_9BACT|nr:GNAT family N-acetyltransferase [Mycoplasmopsis caviae]UUD35014.1 GNAT family N-acetyltransferase [Mycoplasmopsis caviae]VDR42159.1 acetyltransferase [Mycoplasmopsis caviae]
MILATRNDKDAILKFLNQEPINNLLIIGDIMTYGVRTSFIFTYIIKEQEEIKAVSLIFNKTILIYDPEFKISLDDLKLLIEKHSLVNINLSEKMYRHYEEEFESNKDKYNIHRQTMALLKHRYSGDTSLAKKAIFDDLEAIVRSRFLIDEFEDFRGTFQQELKTYKNALIKKVSTPFIIKDKKGYIASHACIAISTDKASMIGGVYTLKEHRQKGYALQVVGALCNHIISNKRTPILFFDNPAAGKLYYKIGFEDFGKIFTVKINK